MTDIPKVEGVLEQSRFSIQICEGAPCIHYGDVPLWRTTVELDELDIFLYDPRPIREDGEESEPFSLFCVDGYGDIYTFGMWDTLEEAKVWLANPTR